MQTQQITWTVLHLKYIDQSVDFHSLVQGLTIFLWWSCQDNKNRQNAEKNVALWKEKGKT